MELNKNFWNERYAQADTPWDIGYVSPALKTFIDALPDKNIRVLIPGAGRAYEAVYLFRQGFQQVFVCDWAEESFRQLKTMVPDFPANQLLCTDFFELEGTFDLMLEQTFFCAIPPSLRTDYVNKAAQLLPSGKTLAGLLFASHFGIPGPPFGGTDAEYRKLFSPHFFIEAMEMCKNSILPRAENELFFQLIRK